MKMAIGLEKVASLIVGSTHAGTHGCRSPHAANGQSAQRPAQQQQQQLSNSQINLQIKPCKVPRLQKYSDPITN
jgi:hypothetical protein